MISSGNLLVTDRFSFARRGLAKLKVRLPVFNGYNYCQDNVSQESGEVEDQKANYRQNPDNRRVLIKVISQSGAYSCQHPVIPAAVKSPGHGILPFSHPELFSPDLPTIIAINRPLHTGKMAGKAAAARIVFTWPFDQPAPS
jgi:hypothetical protein